MKNIFLYTSLLLGSGLMVIHTDQSAKRTSAIHTFSRTMKRSRSGEAPVGHVSIVIDKSDYILSVYDEKGWYATYPVVFGNNDLEDKKMEGDKNTPEGSFRIVNKKIHQKWYRFLALDYPTRDSWDKFNKRKQAGEIPSSASIGGGVGIHGTWPHEDFVIDKYKNWTNGCIAMKNEDVDDVYSYTPVGTQVTIQK
jgi:murein L,D-transpeptidase YafK